MMTLRPVCERGVIRKRRFSQTSWIPCYLVTIWIRPIRKSKQSFQSITEKTVLDLYGSRKTTFVISWADLIGDYRRVCVLTVVLMKDMLSRKCIWIMSFQ